MVNKFTINDKILLILNNLKTRAHIRKIAQKTGLNHVTVINNIKILEQLGIVGFETVGKNKEYFLLKNKTTTAYLKIARIHSKLK